MFVFRLERVLKFRKKVEEEAQRFFSKKHGELLQIRSSIHAEQERLTAFFRENPLRQGVFTAFELMAVDNFIGRIHGTIRRLRDKEKLKVVEVASARDELVKARKETKLLENLKKRRLAKYIEDELRMENNEIDDMNQKISVNREKLTIDDVPLEDM
jgi:flagellar export protein FliJ